MFRSETRRREPMFPRRLPGALHQPGCDMERCPFCAGQFVSCDRCYRMFGIEVSPGPWADANGLPEEQEAQWDGGRASRLTRRRLPR